MSARRAVVLVVTPSRMIKIYHSFFTNHEFRSCSFLHLYGGNGASCFLLTFVILYKILNLEIWNFCITADLCNRCSVACTLFTFSWWMGQCCPFKYTSFSLKREIVHSGNLKWKLLSCNRNLKFQRPYTKIEVRHAVLEHWKWLSTLLIGRKI